jgi:ABC-type enterochelin transport system permease subunit
MKKFFKNLGLKIWDNPIKFSAGISFWILLGKIYYDWIKAEEGSDIQLKIYFGLIVAIIFSMLSTIVSFTNRKLLLSIEQKINNIENRRLLLLAQEPKKLYNNNDD